MPSDVLMKIEVYSDTDAVTKKAAALVAVEAKAAVAARGDFVMAASGGHTAWQMLLALAGEDVPRDTVHVVQVLRDTRTEISRTYVRAYSSMRPERIHAMPAESSNLRGDMQRKRADSTGHPRFNACARPHSPGTRTCGTRA